MSDLAAFEARFQARRHARMAAWLAGSAVLLALVAVTGWVAEVSPTALALGLPRAGDYLVKLIPDLRLAVLFDGTKTEGSLAFWMYRADQWLWQLFETSQIAALATLSGTVVAFLLCFPAAANPPPTA